MELYEAFKAKGVDAVARMAFNDVLVMDAWGKSEGAKDKELMLADGNGDCARALGLGRPGHRLPAAGRRRWLAAPQTRPSPAAAARG